MSYEEPLRIDHKKSKKKQQKWRQRNRTGDPLHYEVPEFGLVVDSVPEHRDDSSSSREEVQSDLLHEFADWLQEFRENLVDESVLVEHWGNPEPGYRGTSKASHELPMEPRAKSGTRFGWA